MRNWRFDEYSTRHNVIDKYIAYTNMDNLEEVNWSTILNDIDGSLTGLVSSEGTRTVSLSRNAFLDAKGQVDECLSFGLQTTSADMVTLVVADLIPVDASFHLKEHDKYVGQYLKLWRQNVINGPSSVPFQGQEPAANEVCEPCQPAPQQQHFSCSRASLLFNPGTVSLCVFIQS